MIRVTLTSGEDIYMNSKKIISFGYSQEDRHTWVTLDFGVQYFLTTHVDQLVTLIKEAK